MDKNASGKDMSIRGRVHRQLDPTIRLDGLSPLNLCLAVLIVLAVVACLLETEPTLSIGRERLFRVLELGFAITFALEYLARIWIAAEGVEPADAWRARWRWVRSPWAIVDVIAFVPALLGGLGPAYLLRMFRLARILRLAKLGRFSKAWSLLSDAVSSRRYELMLTVVAALFVLIVSATLLYAVEGPAQPEEFGSIPRALWWSVVTLTTIGYGDVYPITTIGKILTGITAVIGVGLIATPAGIIAAALSDALQKQKRAANEAM